MGRKRRRKRQAEELASASARPAPQDTGWLTRCALAFLIIFVLLWLFAPREDIS